MKLWAISDLHLKYKKNRELLEQIANHQNDWLILAGDIGEGVEELEFAFRTLSSKFAKLIWVPGNHELWTLPNEAGCKRGEEKYFELIQVCQKFGVLTPEDAYAELIIGDQEYVIVPVFLLYDYSFRPDEVDLEKVIEWAAEADIVCADEHYLFSDPYQTKLQWCHQRYNLTADRLKKIPKERPIILINHFPLRRDLIRLFRFPRFEPWCGTRLTENWHKSFNIKVVVSGHLHVRATDWRDGVRFEEVSLGNPDQRRQDLTADQFLREILPADDQVPPGPGVLRWTY